MVFGERVGLWFATVVRSSLTCALCMYVPLWLTLLFPASLFPPPLALYYAVWVVATLMVEVDNKVRRDRILRKLPGIERHVLLEWGSQSVRSASLRTLRVRRGRLFVRGAGTVYVSELVVLLSMCVVCVCVCGGG